MKILIVEDNALQLKCIRRELDRSGMDCSIDHCVSLQETLEVCQAGCLHHDVILLDLHLGDSQGIDTLETVQAVADKPIFVLTSDANELTASQAKNLGASGFLVKNAGIADRIKQTILTSIAQHRGHDQRSREIDVRTRASKLDGLTGVLNRSFFDQRLIDTWNRSRQSQRPFSVIMVDLDHLGAINLDHGHDAGDFVLQQTAASITTLTRPGDYVCRYGGEMFAVILPETESQLAVSIAEQIRTEIGSITIDAGEATIRVTASLGVAQVTSECQEADDVVRQAAQVLEQAKRLSRDRVVVACYSPA
ncbi:MAG: diguanylate cyclase [Planctomycetota bacterium]